LFDIIKILLITISNNIFYLLYLFFSYSF